MSPVHDESVLLRFWIKVQIGASDECWPWKASRYAGGYGQFTLRTGVRARAHRVAYEAAIGPIPLGLHIDHLCRNRACCNPAHLEAVSPRENVLRGVSFSAQNAGKTHCKHGHEFTKENTHIRPNGHRACRRCAADASRRYAARARMAA